MHADQSKSALLHRQIRRALQCGRFLPGERIDPAAIAEEFRTSPTPVRFALYRLVGERLLSDCARTGLYVPLPTEVGLRDLYDWMERLLLMACDIVAPDRHRSRVRLLCRDDSDVVKSTWLLFDEIAKATGHRSLHQAVRQANDRIAPVRRAKAHLLGDLDTELATLTLQWERGDMAALADALREYHRRRHGRVPEIVAALAEGREGRR
jgi:DNA-binding GntR family transcriptional regulator